MLRLRDIMTTEVLTLAPDTSLRAAVELLSAHHISGAPVMAGQRVVGIISATDILAFTSTALQGPMDRAATVDPDEWLEPPGGQGDDVPLPRRDNDSWTSREDETALDADETELAPQDPLAEYTVSDAMTWGVYALPPSSPAVAAAECMRAADVHRMLVIEDGRLAGIVTTTDFTRAVAEHRLSLHTHVS